MKTIEDKIIITGEQKRILEMAIKLQNKHGENNLVVRYVNKNCGTMFVLHKAGEQEPQIVYSTEYKVNARATLALVQKGLAYTVDIDHQPADNNVFGTIVKTNIDFNLIRVKLK